MDSFNLEILYRWNHTVCDHLLLLFLPLHGILEVHLHCNISAFHFILWSIIFHCICHIASVTSSKILGSFYFYVDMKNSFMCSCCVYIVGCYLFWYQECKSWVTWKLFQNGQCPWRSVCAVCTLLAYLPTLISICLLVYTDSRDCVQL